MILILSGLPGSGKTVYAKEWVAEAPTRRFRINYDDIRLRMFPDVPFSYKNEKVVKSTAKAEAELAIKTDGRDIVVDNTNLTDSARGPWIELARKYGVSWEIYELDTPLATCIRQDKLRTGRARVGRAVIERMALFHGWIDWTDYPGEFVVVDVDGTLADLTERRKYMVPPKDYKHFFADVGADPLIEPIANLVKLLAEDSNIILVVSGRPIDNCGIATEDWLDKHRIPYSHLFMRQGLDYRKDHIVKQEILDLLPKDRIAYVLDDRDSVVEMWRSNGLTCLQVARGGF